MAGNGEHVKIPDKQEPKEVAKSTRFLDTILPVHGNFASPCLSSPKTPNSNAISKVSMIDAG